ncbi:uncharacterized protein E5676_scaffold121G00740 [Cucumis melo var. makuwa]|uniref:Transposase Tnp1/En/Spm-like domain-containing protein n=1 Tax=Cucumis melo var. makuwa TaxID=1194695 RepID=A0A5D3BZ49_CUCMM|nr:uncharacterized protein E6C27_scaffold269G001600 [Cucumis melo var. makuwa]TYK03466.1 uncharacterized protein E5676_scaffold121G00740 [Cucumis melo var. makuwa]
MVKQIQSTFNNEELSKKKPSNIQSTQDWMDFVKEKKSSWFKAKSEKFKSMKKRKLPHTCSRKGYARLAEDMSSFNRVYASSSSFTFAFTFASMFSPSFNRVLPSIKASVFTLPSLQLRWDFIHRMEVTDLDLSHPSLSLSKTDWGLLKAALHRCCLQTETVFEFLCVSTYLMLCLRRQLVLPEHGREDLTIHEYTLLRGTIVIVSINNNNILRKCTLLDWGGTGEVVAEGRWSSNDPKVIVHHVPLGPHAIRVWVDLPKKSDAFLWGPNSKMTYIEDVVGSTVAWPLDKVILS